MKAELGTWSVLLRLSTKQRLESFRKNGEMYMNSLDYFSQLEGDSVRADEYEGISALFQPTNLEMNIKAPNLDEIKVDPAELCGPVRISMKHDTNANAFCLYALRQPTDGRLLDERCEAFGDSCVIVLDSPEFLRRVAKEANARGLFCEAGLVQYYDYQKHQGKLGPFFKVNHFAYQQEFRILARSGSSEALTMRIGDLRDITSEVLPMKELDDRVDFSWKSAREAGYA